MDNEMNLQIKIESYESKMFTLSSKPTTSVNTKTTNIQNLVIADWKKSKVILLLNIWKMVLRELLGLQTNI